MTRSSYALLGITAVAAIARFATLDLQSFDFDEAIIWLYAKGLTSP